MLMPKRVKYRKVHRGRRRGIASRGNQVSFGDFGLQALAPAWLSSRQIEAARRAIVRYLRRGGKLWIRVFPDHPVTKRPAETRMGGGKGAVEFWAAVVRPGLMLFEVAGVTEEEAKAAMRLASHKLPIRDAIRAPRDWGGSLMRPSEIRNLTQVELGRHLDESYQEMFNLRFQYATGQLKNTARLGEVRREIARLRSIMREHELVAAQEG